MTSRCVSWFLSTWPPPQDYCSILYIRNPSFEAYESLTHVQRLVKQLSIFTPIVSNRKTHIKLLNTFCDSLSQCPKVGLIPDKEVSPAKFNSFYLSTFLWTWAEGSSAPLWSHVVGRPTDCPSVVCPSLTFHICDFFSETAERNSTKLERKQDLNVFYQVCVFRADRKTRLPPWHLIGWNIFNFCSETAERN